MIGRSAQLQIRISPEQKALLKELASRAGKDMSAYVLDRALPNNQLRFAELIAALREDDQPSFALAELNDWLTQLASREFSTAVESAETSNLTPFLSNYVAAMVEFAAHQKGVPPPAWVREVEPLEMPHFATPLKGLRLHLLREAPIPFKRRNLFVDSSIGNRI